MFTRLVIRGLPTVFVLWLAVTGICQGVTLFFDDFSTDLGWTGYAAGQWQRGPTAAAACAHGSDPANDYSAGTDNNILGYVLGGCYPNSMSSTISVTSPVIDCSGQLGVQLRFYRVLGMENVTYDHANIEVYNGSSWVEIYHNPGAVDESSWSEILYDVHAYADGNANFQIRFGLGPTDGSVVGAGWNVDDLELYTLDNYCVDLNPPESSTMQQDGGLAIHGFSLINCGTSTDTISLSVAGATWDTIITDASGTEITQLEVPGQSSANIQIRVTVGAGWEDDCVLTATSSVKETSVDAPVHTEKVSFYTEFDTDPAIAGWTGFVSGEWEWGPATASSGCSGTQDPSQDHSGTADNNHIGYDIGGCYPNSMPVKYLTSPPIDLSGIVAVHLQFWRLLGVESDSYDHASIEVSRDGATWNLVWDHVGASFADLAWTHFDYDLQGYLDGQPAAQFRFSMGVSDGSVTYCGWNIDDLALTGRPAAFLEGTVTDDQGPIENALVILDGTNYQDYTDSSGFYHVEAPVGTYDVTASATGHNDSSVTGVELLEGEIVTQNFILTYPEIGINPTALEVTVNINSTTEDVFTISNTGNGLLEFENSIAYLGNREIWDLLYDIDATTPTTDDQILCGEVANGMLWIAGGGGTSGSLPNSLHRFELDGDYIDSIDQGTTSDWGYFDMTSDGEYLYGADANGVYQIDPSTGVPTLMFANPVSNWPLGIAYKSDSDTFVIHAWFDAEFVEVTRTGTIERTWNFALEGMFGISYDTYTTGGPFLWLFDQTQTVAPPSVIYQADISTPGAETLTGVTHNLPMLAGLSDQMAGGLFLTDEWIPGSLIMGGVVQGDPNDKAFALDFGTLSNWLSLDTYEGEVSPSGSFDVGVNFDSHEVDSPGDYLANILVASNDGDEGITTLPVTMHVVAPYWATIDPTYQESAAEAGYSATFNVNINNIGDLDDSYTLGVVSSVWNVSFPGGTTVAVPHGETLGFSISVDVPAGTIPGADELSVFSVTSVGEPTMVMQGEVLTICSVSIGSIGGSVTRDGVIPVQGAIVSVVGTSLIGIADEDGVYLIENVPVANDYTVACSAVGYNPAQVTGIDVAFHQTTEVNFELLYPNIFVDPTLINHQMDPDQQAVLEDAVVINNTGNGYLDYTIELEVATRLERSLNILLVSDPTDGATTPENYDTVYQNAITAAGYASTLWNHDTQGAPTLTDLEPYDVVIWYFGISGSEAASGATGHTTLTLTEESTLTSWLNLGGKSLCLSGMWAAWNCIADANSQTQISSPLFDNYIKLDYPAENFGGWIVVDNSWTMVGQGGPVGGTTTWPLNWASAENYPDQLEFTTGAGAIFNWNDSGTIHHNAGIYNDGGSFRTSLLACPLESIGTTTEQSAFMAQMLGWFEEITSTWIEITPDEGQIIAGANQPLDIAFDTTGLATGYYNALAHIMSNDGDSPEVIVQVVLTVGNLETPTPPPPTNTPGPATSTPTYTPIPPTSTETPVYSETPTPTSEPPTFTPTEPPNPTDTAIPPTSTPTPSCSQMGVVLQMPGDFSYAEDDLCYLKAEICNTGTTTLTQHLLFVILEIEGTLWFYPSWSFELDYLQDDFVPGQTTLMIIDEFVWPATEEEQLNAHFYGAVTNPEISEIIGDYSAITFGWTP